MNSFLHSKLVDGRTSISLNLSIRSLQVPFSSSSIYIYSTSAMTYIQLSVVYIFNGYFCNITIRLYIPLSLISIYKYILSFKTLGSFWIMPLSSDKFFHQLHIIYIVTYKNRSYFHSLLEQNHMWIWDPQLFSIQSCNLFLCVLWLGNVRKFLKPLF